MTQDQPKELLNYFEGQRPAFQKRADDFDKDKRDAIPKQFEALLDFAARAYRRPLSDKQKAELLDLHRTLVKKGESHAQAFRGVLARVLVSPGFLFRVEQAPPGKKAGPIDDWELATRLSYFLASSSPDAELRAAAAAGKLRDPKTLAEQTRRMLKDKRLRALAIEFGTQWVHVRGFDEHKEKNEKLFPMFDATLRRSIYEESILFFQDLFQNDRPVTTDPRRGLHAFLDETLAKHYGIPGVSGPQWRRDRGDTQVWARRHPGPGERADQTVRLVADQPGSPRQLGGGDAARREAAPSPGERAGDPRRGGWRRTNSQRGSWSRRHVKDRELCVVCHVRIDPFGFALEKYDPDRPAPRQGSRSGRGSRCEGQTQGRHRVRWDRRPADVPVDEEEGT